MFIIRISLCVLYWPDVITIILPLFFATIYRRQSDSDFSLLLVFLLTIWFFELSFETTPSLAHSWPSSINGMPLIWSSSSFFVAKELFSLSLECIHSNTVCFFSLVSQFFSLRVVLVLKNNIFLGEKF